MSNKTFVHDYGRTIAFIENAYIFSGQLSEDWRISWRALLEDFLQERYDVWVTRFYASRKEDDTRQKNFFRALNRLGYKLITVQNCVNEYEFRDPDDEDRILRKTVYSEKGLDVQLVTDMLLTFKADSFDTVMLFSGDGIYAPALQAVESAGKRVIVVGWRDSISRQLAEIATEPLVYLDDLRDLLEKQSDTDI